MSFALYCMLFGILVVFPETDGTQLTWNEPLPILTVQESESTQVVHRNRTSLIEGSINASLSWNFSLSSDLTLVSVNLRLGTVGIAAANSQKHEVLAGYKDKYAINWISNQRITLVIFKVTTEHNATFACDVVATKSLTPTWRSLVQVDVVAPPSNIVASDQTITAPAELTLNCLADGKPTPTIFWTRVSDNTNVSMSLNITGGKNEESYRCTAYNGVGNPLSKIVKISILFLPKVILAQKVFVGREETASLYCEVEGNPPPTISWSPCDEGNPFCNEQYLNISQVQSSRANYMCTARNRVGTASGTTVLLIGGKNIYLRLSVIGECDKNVSVWEALVKELPRVFANTTQNYSGAELLKVRCGSLIFDVALKFTSEVAEEDTISIIQNATKDGKLGELSLNVSHIIGIPRFPHTTTTAPTSTTPKSDDNNTGLIIGAVLGSVAFVALIFLIVWCVRKKKCCCETKEVSDKNADAGQGRKGKGPNGTEEVAYASTSMLPNSKIPVEKTNQSTVQALPMYAQVDKTKKTSNKGGAAQRQRQPGELQYAEVEHVPSGKSLPRKSSSEPIKPSNEEIVYADLV